MTAIAYKNGYLAADSCISSGGITLCVDVKVRITDDGDMITGSGNESEILAFEDWYMQGNLYRSENPHPSLSEGTFIAVIKPDGSGTEYHSKGREPVSRISAYGCFDYLMGAMHAGASAEDAVVAAAKNCAGCGFPVRIYKAGKLVKTIHQDVKLHSVLADQEKVSTSGYAQNV